MSPLTPIAIGFRAHSGWAALVAVQGSPLAPVVLERRRIEIADRSISGSVQPYHAAKELNPIAAAKFLDRCRDSSRALAHRTLQTAIDDLRNAGHNVTGCGILLSSGRPTADLEVTLRSHAAIHSAEGEFFRTAIMDSCERCGLACSGFREKEIYEIAAAAFRISAGDVQRRLAGLGKTLGPPWRQDEKCAALAGWLALNLPIA